MSIGSNRVEANGNVSQEIVSYAEAKIKSGSDIHVLQREIMAKGFDVRVKMAAGQVQVLVIEKK